MLSQSTLNTKTIISAAASLAASAMLIRSFANEFIPTQFQYYLFASFDNLFRRFSSQLTILIDEHQGLYPNQVFLAVETYLGSRLGPSARRIKLGKAENEKELAVTPDKDEVIIDEFENLKLQWKFVCTQLESSSSGYQGEKNVPRQTEIRSYELSFHKQHKEKILNAYIPYIAERYQAIKEKNKATKLHTVSYGDWNSSTINLDHPMTFDTLAMDSTHKKALMEDLDNFISRKSYYRKVGKAWKRGYLLHGPPGTGKSSLVAAMANYLNYDIYDLDLTDVHANMDLRFLLLGMSNRSILVIEDIDCGIKLENRESDENNDPNQKQPSEVTLSGLLNFVDGLWSSCADGQIIVFTTNHKDRLDPALLRPGRMDMHIEMSYCNFSSFQQLASNYLGLCHHQHFEQIERLLKRANVTPAEVAGELMKTTDAETSLQGLIKFLQHKMAEEEKENIKNPGHEETKGEMPAQICN